MTITKGYLSISLIILLLFCACTDSPQFPAGTVNGYKPVYAASTGIRLGASQPIQNPGKIFRYKNFLLISEVNEGIHIVNNNDPNAPQAIGFLRIANNVSIALQDSILIVDHQSSLVSLNISDLNSIKEISRVKVWTLSVPPREGFYFECIDPTKGEVIRWDLQSLTNPQCYR